MATPKSWNACILRTTSDKWMEKVSLEQENYIDYEYQNYTCASHMYNIIFTQK